ncbi:DUF1592 domain-containing protein [Verrucomicrobia bacterium]|nr:DUF1592 domain-containing protein [Verrucomicrobiota bacterium]
MSRHNIFKHWFTSLFWITGAMCLSSSILAGAEKTPDFKTHIEPLLVKYCYDCHGDGVDKGDLVMDEFKSLDNHFQNYELWLPVWENLRAQMMPPAKKSQPSAEERALISKWIERKVFKVDPANPDPGRVTLRRMNRTEYRYAIKDLLNVDFDTNDAFPSDDSGYGFDTIGDVLSISPLLMEKYVDAAREVTSKGIPSNGAYIPTVSEWGNSFFTADKKHDARGFSFDMEGLLERVHSTKYPGEYEVNVEFEIKGSREATSHSAQLEIYVNGKKISERQLGWDNSRSIWLNGKTLFNKGKNTIGLKLIPKDQPNEGENKLNIYLHRVNLKGPLDGSHMVYPKEYFAFFPDGPAPMEEDKRRAYAEKILIRFATRAFRRPPGTDMMNKLVGMALVNADQPESSFEKGIAHAATAILASPRFLFRAEIQPEPNNPGKVVPVDQFALASRLSFFLWSSIPDKTLLELAGQGKLRDQLRPQVLRMLSDSKSKRFFENFVGQWLSTKDVHTTDIDPRRALEKKNSKEAYKIYSYQVKQAMQQETLLFFEHLLKEDRPAHEFLDADYTFLNSNLAKFYGINGVQGSDMRKVMLKPEHHRGGILSHASMHVVTSNPTRTSPVKRGLFILENILGTPPPPAPPDVPELREAAKGKNIKELTMRDLMVLHREQPLCASCHKRMDPIGLALENYSAIGMWRSEQNGKRIDPSGKLITGEAFSDIKQLSNVLANDRRRDFYRCLTEKLLTYSIGRGMEYYDTPTIDKIVTSMEKQGGSMKALLYGVVESAPFQKRRGDGSRLLTDSHN